MSLNILYYKLSPLLYRKINCFIILSILCVLSLILTGCSASADSQTIKTPSEYSEIDQIVEQIREEENIPGIAIVIVQGDGIIYCNAYGVTSVDSENPMTTSTLFDLASLTKSFTALGVLILEDKGLIDIDDPLQKYLPEFQIADSRGEKIKVRQLLNQTSGIPGALSEILIFNDSYDELLTSLGNLRLNNEPGTAFEYADLNYCLLGALIERVSGFTYEEYMDINIFTPLGMDTTTLDPDEAIELGKSDGHQPMYGKVVVRNIPPMKSARAAGWVMSCAEDMGTWLLVNKNHGILNGKQLIPAENIEELHAIAIQYVDNGEEMGYGMGWSTNLDSDVYYLSHCGDTPNFTTDMLMLTDYDTAIAVLVNGQVSNISHSIATEIANMLLGLNLNSINVPWWAHWKALDTLATGLLFSVIGLFIIWIIYLFWLINRFRTAKKCFVWSPSAGPLPPIWQIMFYSLPIVFFSMIITAGNVVISSLYGYNVIEAFVLFGQGAPPGLYLSTIIALVIIFLWGCLLVLVGLTTRNMGSKD